MGESNTRSSATQDENRKSPLAAARVGKANTLGVKTERKLGLGDGTQSPLAEGQRLEPGISSAPRTAPEKPFFRPTPHPPFLGST